MAGLGHEEKSSQRAYLVSIASISGTPKCSREGPSRAIRSRSHCAGVKWQTLDQHQLAGEGVGYRYAAKRRGARDRFPAWLAMDENRYFAMRKHLGGLAAEQQR
jgi:hypothetical protein